MLWQHGGQQQSAVPSSGRVYAVHGSFGHFTSADQRAVTTEHSRPESGGQLLHAMVVTM